MNEETYLKERLEEQIKWYDQKSVFNQKCFKNIRVIEIVAAALIPFLTGVDYSAMAWFIGGLGLIVVIASAINSLYKFQENWIQYRTTSESLKHEKFLYLSKSPPYSEDNRYTVLVQKVEGLT